MSDNLVIIPPDPPKHKEALYDLFGKAFSGQGYWNMVNYCRRSYIAHSHYDWRTSRIGLIGDQLVTHFGVWDYQMRIGVARVRTGGIGGVATDGQHRRRGHMAATARGAIEAMTQAGYDMSILFGLHNFYHRFGYVRAWARTTYFADAAEIRQDLPAGDPAIRVSKFSPRQRGDLDALYNRWYAPYTGTAVRPTYQRNPRPKHWQGYLWSGRDGKPAGYVLVQPKERALVCLEAAGELEKALAALSILCKRRKLSEICFESLPYDHPLAKWLRRGTCRTETQYARSGSAMVRTTNLRSTLTKMTKELSRLLKASDMANWRGKLLICDPRQRVHLAISPGKVAVAPAGARKGQRDKHAIRGGEEIAQLLIGTHSPAEIVEAGGTRLTGKAKALVSVLFPHKHPILGSWDHY